MSRAAFLLGLSAVLVLPAPASAQERATRSVEDYLCTFAGKCGEEPEEADLSIEAPETKGLSLVNPGRAKPASPARTESPRQARAPAQRTAPPRAVARERAAPAQPATRRLASRATRPEPAKASQARRADLLLTFELGSDVLTAQAQAEARVFAEFLLRPELSGRKFVIEGHTDSIGGRAYNLDLSRRRAAAVADFLSSLGVSRDRLDIRGYGFDRPLPGQRASSPTNRRVEALLL